MLSDGQAAKQKQNIRLTKKEKKKHTGRARSEDWALSSLVRPMDVRIFELWKPEQKREQGANV